MGTLPHTHSLALRGAEEIIAVARAAPVLETATEKYFKLAKIF